jgi:hypothetical protein
LILKIDNQQTPAHLVFLKQAKIISGKMVLQSQKSFNILSNVQSRIMNKYLFGRYLLAKGILTMTDVIDARLLQRKNNRMISFSFNLVIDRNSSKEQIYQEK